MSRKVTATKGIELESILPDFTLSDSKNQEFNLYKILEKQSVVLVFIRGQWCPFCNKHLKELENHFSDFEKKGAKVVVLSPETSPFIKKSIEKSNASYTILHDKDLEIAKKLDLVFAPNKIELFMYNMVLGAKIKEAQQNEDNQLPVPATFVIGKDRKVKWRHFEHDYKKRAKASEILKYIK